MDELVRERDQLDHRHAESDEVFGVHGFGSFENDGRGVRTHSECAAVVVLFVVENRRWGEKDCRAKFGACR